MMATRIDVLERQSKPGWLLPYLLMLDVTENGGIAGMDKQELKARNLQPTAPQHFHGWQRWAYWMWIVEHNTLPTNPIPRVPFTANPHPTDEKAIADILKIYVGNGYNGIWFDEAWMGLVKWLLFGFGRSSLQEEVERIPEDVREAWYRVFNLANLLHSPCDWSAYILQGGLQADRRKRSPWSKSTGFFATPLDVCHMMAEITFGKSTTLDDTRVQTMPDCCCGTGSILLVASNHSLRLYGQDIVRDLCLCADLNAWLWMPWLAWMPDETNAMLQERHDQLARFRIMRDVLAGKQPTPVKPQPQAPPGLQLSDSLETRQAAEQRRESAEAFFEAARTGQLEQASLF